MLKHLLALSLVLFASGSVSAGVLGVGTNFTKTHTDTLGTHTVNFSVVPLDSGGETMKVTSTLNDKVEWVVKEINDCPQVDHATGFFQKQIDIKDYDKDGINEVLIPYHVFCGGGVDPASVKVIIRNTDLKVALRGRSLFYAPPHKGYTGEEYKLDAQLANPVLVTDKIYKTVLESAWIAIHKNNK